MHLSDSKLEGNGTSLQFRALTSPLQILSQSNIAFYTSFFLAMMMDWLLVLFYLRQAVAFSWIVIGSQFSPIVFSRWSMTPLLTHFSLTSETSSSIRSATSKTSTALQPCFSVPVLWQNLRLGGFALTASQKTVVAAATRHILLAYIPLRSRNLSLPRLLSITSIELPHFGQDFKTSVSMSKTKTSLRSH